MSRGPHTFKWAPKWVNIYNLKKRLPPTHLSIRCPPLHIPPRPPPQVMSPQELKTYKYPSLEQQHSDISTSFTTSLWKRILGLVHRLVQKGQAPKTDNKTWFTFLKAELGEIWGGQVNPTKNNPAIVTIIHAVHIIVHFRYASYFALIDLIHCVVTPI